MTTRQYIYFDDAYLHRYKQQQSDANGKKLCVNCQNPLPKRRILYCSDKCSIIFYREHVKDWNTIREEVFKRDNYTCQKCGKQFSTHSKVFNLECDHIVPIMHGGKEFDKQNLQTLCKECHKQKTRIDKNPIVGKIKAEIQQGLQQTLSVKANYQNH